MNHFKIGSVIAVAAMLSASLTYSQSVNWQRMSGPQGGIVTAMLFDVNTSKVWTGNGYVSSDNGATWHGATGLRPYVAMAANDSGYLFAGNFNGMVLSSDGGNTWNAVFLPGFGSVISITTHLSDVWVGSYNGKIFHSSDNGSTWVREHDGVFFNADVLALASDGTTLYAGTYGNGVMRTTDNGNTWDTLSSFHGLSNAGVESLLMPPGSGAELFAGVNGGIDHTSNGGNGWAPLLSIFGDVFGFAENVKGGFFYAATSMGFYVSAGGAVWVQSNNGLTTLDLRSICFDSMTGNIYVGTNGDGVFRSTDNGITWEHVGTPVDILSLTAYQGQNVLAATDESLFATSNAGANWSQANTGITASITDLVLADDLRGKLYAATPKGIYRSDDNSASWNVADSGITNHVFRDICQTRAGELFVATSGGLFASTDMGAFWSLETGLIDTVVWDSTVYAVAYDTAGYLYAAKGSGFYRAAVSGNTWQLMYKTLPGTTNCIVVAANGDVLAGLDGQGIYRSSDKGATWTAASGTANAYVNDMVAGPNGMLLAATASDGVFASLDNGASWNRVNSGLENTRVNTLALTSDGYIWAGTDGGVYRSASPLSVRRNASVGSVSLSIYPNPSNGSFSVEAPSDGTMEIIDPLGRTVLSSYVSAGNAQRLALQAPSGTYIYRFSSQGGTTQGAVTVVR